MAAARAASLLEEVTGDYAMPVRFCFLLCAFLLFAAPLTVAASGLFDLAQKGTAAQIQEHLARHRESPADLVRALFLAIENRASDEVLTLLIKSGADVNACMSRIERYGDSGEDYYADNDAFCYSPLQIAHGDPRMAPLLLRLGADPNVTAFEGESPLFHEVTKKEPTPLLHALLKAGADPNLPLIGPICPRPDGDIEGAPCVALEFALHSPEIVRILLDAGARSNRHIHALATRSNTLPPDLLQRLDPVRLPDGSLKTPDSLIQQAIARYRSGDGDGCRAILDDLNASFDLPKPILSAHYFLRSICTGDSLGDAEKALHYDTAQPRNHRQYIAALLRLERYRDALRALPRALKLSPDDARLYLYRASCLMHTGNLREAEKAINKAASLRDLPQLWVQRGELALLQQHPDQAAQHFQTALDKGQKQDAATTWLYLAALHDHAGKQDEALRCLQRARALNPAGRKTHADSYEEQLHSVIMMPFGLLAPTLKDFIYRRDSIVDAQARNWTENTNGTDIDSRAILLQVLAYDVKNASLPQEKAALAYLETFCLADTAQQLKKTALALRLCPKEPVYHFRHGQLLLQQGQYPAARKHLQRAVSLGQKNGLVENLLAQARIAHEQGARDTASQLVKQADSLARHEGEKRLAAAATAALLAGTDWPDLNTPAAPPRSALPAISTPAPSDAAPSDAAPDVELLPDQPAAPASPAADSPVSVELLHFD